MTIHKETYEERWARRKAALQKRLADIPSRFTDESLYQPRPVGQAVENAEVEFFGTSFTVFEKQVKKSARMVAAQWPGLLEAEDVEQEIWVRLMEGPATINKFRDRFDDRNRVNALINMGHQIANRVLTEQHIATGNFRYSVNDVKTILKSDRSELTRTAVLDLKAGMQVLQERNPAHAEAITDRYYLGIVPKQGAAAGKLTRALTALTTHMNRGHKRQHVVRPDGPGTRKAFSTERAKAISHKQYNGDNPRPAAGVTDRGYLFGPQGFHTPGHRE